MIHLKPPRGFNPSIEVVSCFVEHKGDILLLLRQDCKPQPNTWCIPAGKVDSGESRDNAIIREVREETRINLEAKFPDFFRNVYVRYPEFDFVYSIYHLRISGERPEIIINPLEHKRYKWVTPRDSLRMNLIPDEDECIKLFYGI